MKKNVLSFVSGAIAILLLVGLPVTALAEAYGLEVSYDGERNIATVSKQPAQTQAPIADTGYAGFEKQWTVKEKPVTNYGDEKIFTVT